MTSTEVLGQGDPGKGRQHRIHDGCIPCDGYAKFRRPASRIVKALGMDTEPRRPRTPDTAGQDPMMVLRAVIVDGQEQGSGPKKGYVPMGKNQAHQSGVSRTSSMPNSANTTVVKLDVITAPAIWTATRLGIAVAVKYNIRVMPTSKLPTVLGLAIVLRIHNHRSSRDGSCNCAN